MPTAKLRSLTLPLVYHESVTEEDMAAIFAHLRVYGVAAEFQLGKAARATLFTPAHWPEVSEADWMSAVQYLERTL